MFFFAFTKPALNCCALHQGSSIMKMHTATSPFKKLAAVLASLLSCATAMAQDTYDPATGTLSMDSLLVSGQTYNNVVVTVTSYGVQSIGASVIAVDSFDPLTATLSLSSVAVGNQIYNNVVVKINIYALRKAGATIQGAEPCTLYLCMAGISGTGSSGGPACDAPIAYWHASAPMGITVSGSSSFDAPDSLGLRRAYLSSCPGATNTPQNAAILQTILDVWGSAP
jgi:hypothetical protein